MPPRPFRLATLLAVLALLIAVGAARSCAEPAPRPSPRAPRPVAEAPRLPGLDEPEAEPDEIEPPPSADAEPRPFRGRVRVLDNGLSVFLVSDHSAPTIAARLVVRAGAVDDPPDGAGTAHFLEHMLFKGTDVIGTADWEAEAPHIAAIRDLYDRLDVTDDPDERARLEAEIGREHAAADVHALPNEMERLLDAIGATEVNAGTSLEATDFHAVIPPNHLRAWAFLEAERLIGPVFRGFTNERRVVVEEVRLRSRHAEGPGIRDLRRALFPGHPYGRPIGGTEESVAGITPSDLERFWDRWYVPGNAAVVLVGDFDAGDAFGIVEEAFGDIPAAAVPERVVAAAPGSVASTRVAGGSARRIHRAWPLAERSPEDWAAMRVAAHLVERAAERSGAGLVRVRVARYTRGGRVDLEGTCRSRARCEGAVDAAIARLLSRSPGEGTVAAARWGAEIAHLEALESHERQAAEIAEAYARGQGLDDTWREVLAARTVRTEAVVEALKEFGRPYVALDGTGQRSDDIARDPPSTPTDVEDPRRSGLFAELLGLPVEPLPNRWMAEGRDYTISGDGRVVVVPNPCNHLFQVELTYPLGWATDPMMCEAVQRWNQASRRPGAWGDDLARDGVTFHARCDGETTVVRLAGPGANARSALARTLAELAVPVVDARHRDFDDILRSLALGDALETYAAIGVESRYRRFHPTPDELKGATPARLLRSLASLSATRPEVGWVGAGDADEIASLFGGLERDPPDPERIEPSDAIVVVDSRWIEVRLTRFSEAYDPAHEGLYALNDAYLSGATGIVHETIREAQGAAYAIDATYARGSLRPNATRIQVAVAADRIPEVLGAALEVLGRTTLTQSRWDRVWTSTEEHAWSGHVPFRAAPGMVLAWMQWGLEADPREVAWNQLAGIGQEEFEAFLAREAARPVAISVQTRVDGARLRALERFGPVEVVTESDVLR